jgi:hypothetical protein
VLASSAQLHVLHVCCGANALQQIAIAMVRQMLLDVCNSPIDCTHGIPENAHACRLVM